MKISARHRGTVDISSDKRLRRVEIVITGQFDDIVMKDFFDKYIKVTTKVQRNEYDLFIDCRDLKVFQVHLLNDVRQAYQRYREFKTVTFYNPRNTVGKMQIQRLAKEEGCKDFFTFLDI